MTPALTTWVRWMCDPAKHEVLEGDLAELYAWRRAAWGSGPAWRRTMRDALSASVFHSRLTSAAERHRLAPWAVTAALTLIVVAAGVHGSAGSRYTVNASDPAGKFTLEIEGRRVLAATLDGVPVPPERLWQQGGQLVIRGGDGGRDFRIALKPEGGITWDARRTASR